MLTVKNLMTKVIICVLVLLIVCSVSTLLGTEKISIAEVFKGPGDAPGDNIHYEIFMYRLKRIIVAALVGAGLAGAGVIFQVLLRNPLADPYILGISSGAGLGAMTAIILGIGFTTAAGSATALFAFTGAILTVMLVWRIGSFAGKGTVASLLLAGVVVNAFFSSVIMFLISIAKSDQLRSTVYWLMGNISEKSWKIIGVSSACIIGSMFILLSICQRLNSLSLGDDEAKGLGVDVSKTRAIAFTFTTFITAVSVSLSGLIGFIGLIVPHGVRLISGPDHRQLLPLSVINGAVFLVIADTIARTVFEQEQLPVGVITAIAGGPFFLVLLAKYSRKVGWAK